MVERDLQFTTKIKQGGIFNYRDFYSFAYDWLASQNYDIIEKTYTEKVSGESKQVEIKWEAWRKISDYFKYVIQIEWMILGMKDI
ncbi:hypothetical protein GF386_02620, partial [Candidatus Pacearchaeota archaeon]|nr:hypothetical protein [Candidatus Pacearchaeota archaeon]MBD3283042.1 hypothetical protein [Candidatus Pacearchaeota archaeon]